MKQNKTNPNCVIAKNENTATKIVNIQKNVLRKDLQLASVNPLTGYFRNGYCTTDNDDKGLHFVAAVVTEEFLEISKFQGNDLITPYPYPANNFLGLKPGDVCCLCVLSWKEALDKGVASPVILEVTNIKA